MRRVLTLLAIPAALLVARDTGRTQPVVTCPRAPDPPILDGNVTADEWVSAGRMSPFLLLRSEGLPREATDVRVMYDDDALYVGAVMYDSDTDALRAKVTETDGNVYEDDCFELFIDAMGGGDSYVHLVVNSIGTRFDEMDGDRLENFRWLVGVAVREGEWSVEIALPFTGGRPPPEASVWHVGAARHAPMRGEYSNWNGFAESFHEPQRFGQLIFGGPGISFKLVDMGAMKLGRNSAVLFADNATADTAQFKANVRVHGRDRAGHFFGSTKFTALAGNRTPIDVPYKVIQDGMGSALLSVTDTQGKVVYRTAPFPVRIPAVAGVLFQVEAALAEAIRAGAELPESETKEELRERLSLLSDQWQALARLVEERTSLDSIQLREVERSLEGLLGRAERLNVRLRAAAAGHGDVGSFTVTPVTSLTKVFPDEYPAPSDSEARIDACRNEWESVQLAIVPLTDRVVSLSVQVTDLEAPRATIPADRVQVRAVGNVPAADHLASGVEKRLWPDILTPALGEKGIVKVPPTETRALWISVHVPRDVPAGEYAGTLIVSDGGESTVALPLRVLVHSPVLPSPGDYNLSLGFWQAPQRIARQYGLELWSQEHWDLLRAYLADLAEHGQKLASVTRDMFEWRRDEAGRPAFSYTVFDRYVALCREVGIDEGIEYYSMFSGREDTTITWADANDDAHSETANPGDEAFDSIWSAFLTDLANHVSEKGWQENVFICPTDEPRDGPSLPTLKRFEHCAKLVRAAHPGLKVTVALDSLESARTLAPHIDRMVLKLRDDVYDRELAEAKRAAGGLVEAYICCHPQRPNTFVTSPNIDSRVIGWLLFRENLDGLLRWSYERWPPDPMSQPEGDGRYAAGDLFIVYPGPEGPYASPRWELLRDGFEDYELLRLLREAVQKARAAGRDADADAGQEVLNEALARVTGEGGGLAEFSDDPSDLLLARVKVLTTLDWLASRE